LLIMRLINRLIGFCNWDQMKVKII
jgi:hypothetical protein